MKSTRAVEHRLSKQIPQGLAVQIWLIYFNLICSVGRPGGLLCNVRMFIGSQACTLDWIGLQSLLFVTFVGTCLPQIMTQVQHLVQIYEYLI